VIRVAMSPGDDERSRNTVVERRKASSMSHSQPDQMAVGELAAGLHPLREIRGAVLIRQLNDDTTTSGSKPSQEPNRLSHRHPQVRGLVEDPHEPKLRDRTGGEAVGGRKRCQPRGNSVVMLVGRNKRGDQNIHIQQPGHGKSAKSSLTWPDESGNERGLDFRTGSPVRRSIPNTGRDGRGRIGSRTILSASRAISNDAPGKSPSFRRTVAGSTTWPLLERVVLMVRISYVHPFRTATLCGQTSISPRPLATCWQT